MDDREPDFNSCMMDAYQFGDNPAAKLRAIYNAPNTADIYELFIIGVLGKHKFTAKEIQEQGFPESTVYKSLDRLKKHEIIEEAGKVRYKGSHKRSTVWKLVHR